MHVRSFFSTVIMANESSVEGFVKRVLKFFLQVWLDAVGCYAEDQRLRRLLEFWPDLIWLAVRRRQFMPIDYDVDAIERGNAYIDKLLKDMFEDGVEEYDPYIIDDSVVGFSKKILLVNISGEAKLHSGFIKGLRTLHRPNDCSLEEENGRLNVKADLGAGVLDCRYSGSVKFMNFGPTITIQAVLSYLEIHMEFSVDKETGRDGTLNKFQIDDMRGMKAWVTGLGPLNWAVNPVIKGVTVIFKRFIRNFMERKVKNHLANKIPNFQFPVEGDLETKATEVASSSVTAQELISETAESTSGSREPEVSDVTESTTETTEQRETVSEELRTVEETTEETVSEELRTVETTEEIVSEELRTVETTEETVSEELRTVEETTDETVSEELRTVEETVSEGLETTDEETVSVEPDVMEETSSGEFEITGELNEETGSELEIADESIVTEKEAIGPLKTEEAANLVSEKEVDVREPVEKSADPIFETEVSEVTKNRI